MASAWFQKSWQKFKKAVRPFSNKDNPELLEMLDVGLPTNGHLVAFGHFTSEKNLDLFILDDARRTVTVYLWDMKTKRYRLSAATITVGSNQRVVNVVPSDFDHDGFLDLLVMSVSVDKSTDKSGTGSTEIKHEIYFGNGSTLSLSGIILPSSSNQLTLFDQGGRMQIDLLGHFGTSSKSPSMLRANADDAHHITSSYKKTDFVPALNCEYVEHPWNIFADVNGDGRPDLLLQCGTQERIKDDLLVLVNTPDVGFSAGKRHALPKGASQMTIVDINGNGSPDLVFTVCDPPDSCANTCQLHIVYNSQRPFCQGKGRESKCKSAEHPFTRDPSFDFAFNTEQHQVIDIRQIIGTKEVLVRKDPINKLPVALSFGDFDLDGYPDLLLTVTKNPSSPLDSSRIVLLKNVQCKAGSAGCTPFLVGEQKRTFDTSFDKIDALSGANSPIQAAFADSYGNGHLGVIVNGYDVTNKATVNLYQNDAFTDAFFVRTESLNGVCPAPCANKDTGSKAARPFGVNYVGATFRMSFTDIDGATKVRYAAQLPQTSNRALMMPFSIFGLGRTNSFVESFSAATSSNAAENWHTQTHIIPNSDLVVMPPHADNSSWQFQVHIHPASHLIWVTVSLVISLTILVSITGYFKIKERREDEAEKRKRAHAINFDAM